MGDLDDLAAAAQSAGPQRTAAVNLASSGSQRVWHVTDRNRRAGPVSADDLRTFLADGRITHNAIVWQEGMTEWVPVAAAVGPIAPQPQTLPQPRPFAAFATVPPSLPTAVVDRHWLIHDRGQQLGPYSIQDVSALLAAGNITPQALAWREGNPQWLPVASVVPPVPVAFPPRVAAVPAYRPVETNRIGAGLCGILLGSLGIHKFILGYSSAGITMLLVSVLTCGWGAIVMGIIGLIEGITYLTRTDAQFYQEYVLRKKPWF